jgi:hypothetical protein
VTDEGHSLKLARVLCILCNRLSSNHLGLVLKSHFYLHCPLVIPKHQEEGLTGDAFFANMAFKEKKSREVDPNTNAPKLVWEQKGPWLERMSKVLCVYAVLCVQPEQTPLVSEG